MNNRRNLAVIISLIALLVAFNSITIAKCEGLVAAAAAVVGSKTAHDYMWNPPGSLVQWSHSLMHFSDDKTALDRDQLNQKCIENKMVFEVNDTCSAIQNLDPEILVVRKKASLNKRIELCSKFAKYNKEKCVERKAMDKKNSNTCSYIETMCSNIEVETNERSVLCKHHSGYYDKNCFVRKDMDLNLKISCEVYDQLCLQFYSQMNKASEMGENVFRAYNKEQFDLLGSKNDNKSEYFCAYYITACLQLAI